jgi:hypothetical protein
MGEATNVCFYLRGAKVWKLLTLGKSKVVKHFFLKFVSV